MAIQKAITHDSGVVLASAYHRVLSTKLVRNAHRSFVEFTVGIFKDQAARDDSKTPLKEINRIRITNVYPSSDFDTFFDISVLNQTDVNVIKQCYEWMKTQSDIDGVDYTEGVTDV